MDVSLEFASGAGTSRKSKFFESARNAPLSTRLPLYGALWISDDLILVAGGGGSATCGIQSGIIVCKLITLDNGDLVSFWGLVNVFSSRCALYIIHCIRKHIDNYEERANLNKVPS